MPQLPNDATTRAWARLVRAEQLLLARIEAELKGAGLPPLRWYDVLLELRRAGRSGLRQFEIGEAVLLTKYNVSRLLGRLEGEGLLVRYVCEEDARGARVLITEEGEALLKRMWAVYGRALGEHFGRHFTAAELEQLAALLGRLPGVAR